MLPIAREAYEETLSGKLPHMPSEPKMLYLATAREDHAKDGTLITNFSGKIDYPIIIIKKKNQWIPSDVIPSPPQDQA